MDTAIVIAAAIAIDCKGGKLKHHTKNVYRKKTFVLLLFLAFLAFHVTFVPFVFFMDFFGKKKPSSVFIHIEEKNREIFDYYH